MESFKNKVFQATDFVRSRIEQHPHIGLLIGTGLGESVSNMKKAVSIDYGEIPNFPISTVPTHRGQARVWEYEREVRAGDAGPLPLLRRIQHERNNLAR